MKITITESLINFACKVECEFNERVLGTLGRNILKSYNFRWNGDHWYTYGHYNFYALKRELDKFGSHYQLDTIYMPSRPYANVDDDKSYDGSGDKLRQYQIDDVDFYSSVDFGICGNSMRTGKSAIMSKLAGNALNRVIMIVPNSILYVTAKNLSKWTNGSKSVQILDTDYMKAREIVELDADISIIPLSMVAKVGDRMSTFGKYNFIIDESQKCTSNKSNRSKGFKQLFAEGNVAAIHMFTGTAYNNGPHELITQADNFNTKHLFDNIPKFRYDILGQELTTIETGWGQNKRKITTYTAPSLDPYYSVALKEYLKSINYKRIEKRDILDELPEVIHQRVDITKFNYTKKELEVLDKGDIDSDNMFTLARKYALKKVKSPEFKEFFHDKVNKTIICYYHNEVLAEMIKIADKLEVSYSVVSGDGHYNVDKEVANFQDGNNQVIFLQLSMVEGLTLHSATEMFMVELPYTKSSLDQATDRFWDYDNKDVKTVYYILDDQGVDSRKLDILTDKANLAIAYENHSDRVDGRII